MHIIYIIVEPFVRLSFYFIFSLLIFIFIHYFFSLNASVMRIARFVHFGSKSFVEIFNTVSNYTKFPVVLTAFNLFTFVRNVLFTYGCVVKVPKQKKNHKSQLNWCICLFGSYAQFLVLDRRTYTHAHCTQVMQVE